eukprot:270856-Pleurochrysis_carterae.AAC.3
MRAHIGVAFLADVLARSGRVPSARGRDVRSRQMYTTAGLAECIGRACEPCLQRQDAQMSRTRSPHVRALL